MKATENQQVRASYPSTQATSPVGTVSSTAPAIRGTSHFANDVELLAPVDEHVGEGRERTDEEVDAEIPGAQRSAQGCAEHDRQRGGRHLPEHEVEGVPRDRGAGAARCLVLVHRSFLARPAARTARRCVTLRSTPRQERRRVQLKPTTISFFGNFGMRNFGNECTLQAILQNVTRFLPDARANCICTYPQDASARHHIPASLISYRYAKGSASTGGPDQNAPAVLRWLRRLAIRLPLELNQLNTAHKE